jgi:hypothetical protein
MLYFFKLQDKFEVYLFSANPRNKNKVVAIGYLITQDKTYVVGGNMLGDEYCTVLVNVPTPIADEKLPRLKIFKLLEMTWVMLSLGLGSM